MTYELTRRRLLGLSAGALLAATIRPTWSVAQSDDYAHADWLITPDALRERLDDPSVRVIALTPSEDFAAAHIPGAAQVDWPALELSNSTPEGIERWEQAVDTFVGGIGLTPDQTVVAYDGGTLWAARLWWVLTYLGHTDIHVLNGGLPAWTAADYDIDTGAFTPESASDPYPSQANEEILATVDEVLADLNDPNTVIVDARTPDEYATGHIPGAVNVNFPLNAEPDDPKFWKAADDLLALYADVGVTPDKRVIPYCSTGVRSAVTYFTLRLLGFEDVSLYSASWAEWGSRPDTPKEQG